MSSILKRLILVCLPLSLSTVTTAQTIDLVHLGTVDVSALGMGSWGGGDIDPVTGHMWVSDGDINTSSVFEIDPVTGQLFSSFPGSVIPGLDKGPDGLAIQPGTGNVFLFSPFAENEAGVVTQAGVLVTEFTTASGAVGAAFHPNGDLWVYNDGPRTLQRLNPLNGALLSSLPIQGITGRIPSMEFHPITGNLLAFHDDTAELLEIDIVTGQVLATADMIALGVTGFFGTAMAVDPQGQRLYIGRGWGADAGFMHVLGFGASATPFCFGDGTGTTCPCGNLGGPEEGCANSAGIGATLSNGGSANVGLDDLSFHMANGPGPSPALLFAGTQQVNGGIGSLFGDGLLCAGGAIQRLNVQMLDGTGAASWGPGLAPMGGWAAGDTRVFQVWYRDVTGSPCGNQFNTSHALSIDFQP